MIDRINALQSVLYRSRIPNIASDQLNLLVEVGRPGTTVAMYLR
jgi:hypothetical protein